MMRAFVTAWQKDGFWEKISQIKTIVQGKNKINKLSLTGYTINNRTTSRRSRSCRKSCE
jgi:hypothetical protein